MFTALGARAIASVCSGSLIIFVITNIPMSMQDVCTCCSIFLFLQFVVLDDLSVFGFAFFRIYDHISYCNSCTVGNFSWMGYFSAADNCVARQTFHSQIGLQITEGYLVVFSSMFY